MKMKPNTSNARDDLNNELSSLDKPFTKIHTIRERKGFGIKDKPNSNISEWFNTWKQYDT